GSTRDYARSPEGTRPPAVCADRGQPSGAPGDGELVLGVLDALLELPAVGRRLAAFDLLELGLRALELLARALVVDLARLDRVVDECDRAVLEHLEEAGAGRELLDLVSVEVRVHARRARLQQRDERRVPREDADLAGLAGNDDHLRLALVRRALRRHERHVELAPLGHYAASASASSPGCSSSCPAIVFPRSTACSIVPTM